MIFRPTSSIYFLLLSHLGCSNFVFKTGVVSAQDFGGKSLGGELAYFNTPQMTPGVSHRQNICDRYAALNNRTMRLEDVLQGLKLNVVVGAYAGSYFNYNNETGIQAYGGIAAEIMDELAKRGGFTWRDSFDVYDVPAGGENETWTDLLVWSTDTYDLSIDWWARSLDRMNLGVAFLRDWYDSSIILIAKENIAPPDEDNGPSHLFNFLAPLEWNVWYAISGTIVLGGLVFLVIEWLSNHRNDRKFWVWWSEGLYLSAMNATQVYEYGIPRSAAAKLFGVSSAFWGLIITATYTANLASLLVDGRMYQGNNAVSTIEEVAYLGFPVCTWHGTILDTHLEANYASVKRRPKKNLLDVYDALNSGECEFAADTTQGWLENENKREFNPNCELEWVGDRKIATIGAGFSSKVDVGVKCTSLLRDAIDYYMEQLISEGFMEEKWEIENKRKQDIDCDTFRPGLQAFDGESDAGGRRLQRWQHEEIQATEYHRRRLKSSTKAASSAGALEGGGGSSGGQMRFEDMVGTFMIHWSLMGIALLVAVVQQCGQQKRELARKMKTAEKSCCSDFSEILEVCDELAEKNPDISKGDLSHQIHILSAALEKSKKSETRRMEEQMELREQVVNLSNVLQKFIRGTKEVQTEESPTPTQVSR